jgi:hypothetical protein
MLLFIKKITGCFTLSLACRDIDSSLPEKDLRHRLKQKEHRKVSALPKEDLRHWLDKKRMQSSLHYPDKTL